MQTFEQASTDMMPFPVVGIGASAGGLPAVLRLLEQMPPASGMALVVVLHLSADTPNTADRLLQRATPMPVLQVRERMRLEPNRVYVISPGYSLTVDDGHLVVKVRPRLPGMPATIDIFMASLAEAHGAWAIGVLLSGMGVDGVAGLASIKERGGIAIAQLPADAEESSMPQTAIDSGVVDFVLPAAEIPARLLDMHKLMRAIREGGPEGDVVPALPAASIDPDVEKRLHDILALLYNQTGHDFRHYKQQAVLRRLERRLRITAVPDLQAYMRRLEQDPQESQVLAQDLLIGVTHFFRDQKAFVALEKSILPRIFHDRTPEQALRAWVAGCSTGEEAYSVAMLLAERAECIAGAPAMQIFATDIDERALTVARAGRYPDAIAADVAPERLARFFTPDDDCFKVRKLLRDRILFARHDLLHDPAFSRLDLITCRNVLMYLNRDVQRSLLEIFHNALNPGAFLFLGSTEAAELASDLFVAVDGGYRLYQARPHRNAVRRLSMLPPTRMAVPQVEAFPGALPSPGEPALPSFAELHQRTLAQAAPPSLLVDGQDEIVHVSEGGNAFLRYGSGEPSRQVLALMLPALRTDLRTTMFQARRSGETVRSGPVRYYLDGKERSVDLAVVPVSDTTLGTGLLLVCFDAVEAAPASAGPGGARSAVRVRELEAALLRAQYNLQQTIEQAEASNAVLAKTNEALQEKVDKLQASLELLDVRNEELQSRNEELYTINAELQMQLDETARAHDDLSNLITSSDIATLFLDPRLRIQRYTPGVTSIFNILPADVGRPLAHLSSKVDMQHLLDEVVGVCSSGQALECEARSSDGHDYIVRVDPYRTSCERVEGAVLTFFDISRGRAACRLSS